MLVVLFFFFFFMWLAASFSYIVFLDTLRASLWICWTFCLLQMFNVLVCVDLSPLSFYHLSFAFVYFLDLLFCWSFMYVCDLIVASIKPKLSLKWEGQRLIEVKQRDTFSASKCCKTYLIFFLIVLFYLYSSQSRSTTSSRAPIWVESRNFSILCDYYILTL